MTGAIESRLESVRRRIGAAAERAGRDPQSVALIGVSKGQPAAAVDEAVRAGLRDIGESRVQEAAAKRAACGTGALATWHLIGHLQTNKARAALETFAILHSVDSERLIRTLGSLATRPATVFIEINVTGEATKYGASAHELPSLLRVARDYPNLEVRGLMTVAPLTSDPEAAREPFRALAALAARERLPYLSMGMSDDYEIAIEEGATHVRIGRAIFGERP